METMDADSYHISTIIGSSFSARDIYKVVQRDMLINYQQIWNCSILVEIHKKR